MTSNTDETQANAPDEQTTSAILEPEELRTDSEVSEVIRGKTSTTIRNIDGATFQGMGPENMIVGIDARNETKVRRKLEDSGIHVATEKFECEYLWVGIPDGQTLYEITSTDFSAA